MPGRSSRALTRARRPTKMEVGRVRAARNSTMSETQNEVELISYVLRTGVYCGACRNLVPVNGFAESVDCPQCGRQASAERDHWKMAYDEETFQLALTLPEGQLRESQILGVMDYHWGHKTPACGGCQAELSLQALAAQVEQGGAPCPGCGERVPIRPADGLAQELHPDARFVVGEALRGDATRELDRARRPVVFQCMQCAATLRVDGCKRTVECSYCQASNYLPDGLWRELNPVPVMREYYLVCELSQERKLLARANDRLRQLQSEHPRPGRSADLERTDYSLLLLLGEDADKRDVLENPATPAETLEEFARSFDPDTIFVANESLFELAAAHPSLAPETIAWMVETTKGTPVYSEIKRALARNPNTPSDALSTLAAEFFDDEVVALAKAQLRARGHGGSRKALVIALAVAVPALAIAAAMLLNT
jgi:uncharacterized CHY-type Zn-finger protein